MDITDENLETCIIYDFESPIGDTSTIWVDFDRIEGSISSSDPAIPLVPSPFDSPEQPKSLRDFSFSQLLIANDLLLPHTSSDDLETLLRIIDVAKVEELVEERDHLKRALETGPTEIGDLLPSDRSITKQHRSQNMQSLDNHETNDALLVQNCKLRDDFEVLEACLAQEAEELDATKQTYVHLMGKVNEMQRTHQLKVGSLNKTIVKISATDDQLCDQILEIVDDFVSLTESMGVDMSFMSYMIKKRLNEYKKRIAGLINNKRRAEDAGLRNVEQEFQVIDGAYYEAKHLELSPSGLSEDELRGDVDDQRSFHDWTILPEQFGLLSEMTENLDYLN